jgi:Putative peptidoglycan binding domain
MKRHEFSRNVLVGEATSRNITKYGKERMKISSLTGALRNAVVALVLLASIIGAQAADPHRKHLYAESGIVPAYRHYDQHQLRQVQIALRRQGYYSGAADGFLGYKTDIAISKFQLEHRHPVRPIVDQWLLVTLGIVKPVAD